MTEKFNNKKEKESLNYLEQNCSVRLFTIKNSHSISQNRISMVFRWITERSTPSPTGLSGQHPLPTIRM